MSKQPTKNVVAKPKRCLFLVARVDQSPMNAARWCIELSCGHDHWLTAKRRPTVKSLPCPTCERQG